MVLPIPRISGNPIPNDPFYSPPVYITKGDYYPITIGSGLVVDPVTAIMTSTGGGGGVTGIFAGPGISVSGNTGNVTITNAGIRGVAAGSGISVSVLGNVATITNLNNGTVTGIIAGNGLSAQGGPPGGTITSSGTLELTNTGVTAGSYSNPTLVVDAQGRITNAISGTALQSLTVNLPLTITAGVNPTLSINAATTLGCGVVQLSDSVSLANSTYAATSLAVKNTYDVAIAAIPKSCITGCGALVTGIAASTPVALPLGADGTILTACLSAPSGLCWATFTPCTGTVTSITAGTGLTATPNPIVASGTIALAPATGLVLGGVIPDGTNITVSGTGAINLGPTGVVAASYTNANITVDSKGRLTAASNGFVPGNATPTVPGLVLGCTTANVAALGCNALLVNGGIGNAVVGPNAMCCNTSGYNNAAIGSLVLSQNTTGLGNSAIGTFALISNINGNSNTALGLGALSCNTSGCFNVGVGAGAGQAITTGCCNVAIGYCTAVASPTGNCQLAIGFSPTSNWLTGDCTKAIQPGGGIIDCTTSCGTANMVLTSQGNAIQWKPVSSGIAAPNYGNFSSNANQLNLNPGVGQPVTFTDADGSTNMAINPTGDGIIIACAGVYNVQYSLEYEDAVAALRTIEVWFAVNNVAVPRSNTEFHAKGSGEKQVAVTNFIVRANAGDDIQVYWASSEATMSLSAFASNYGGPNIPSAIVTIVPVGA